MNEDVHLLLDSLGSSIPGVDASAHFRGKRITVMGLGLLGRGVGDARYLAEQDAELIVTDLKSREELATSVAQLEAFTNVTFVLGEHRLEDFRGRDLILKAAGVPLDSAYIAEAKKNGIPVRMSADLFAEMSGVACIGITGTRGKSTVAHMLHTILKAAGKPVLLGGNVRGVSTLALLAEATPAHIAVLELDSWQLQGFGELQISPRIAIMTNLMQDHQNYYPDMETYFADKANIFRYHHQGDTLICGPGVAQRVSDAKPLAAPMTPVALPDDWRLKIIGQHNRDNAALAAAALTAAGLSASEVRDGMESFEGVEGRLQFVREVRGVKIYNDNNATTPEATVAALRALNVGLTKSHIVLITGGSDKGLDTSELVHAIRAYAKKVVFLGGTGTDTIKNNFPDAPIVDSLAKALEAAMAISSPGDTILFSPAFASFGMFKNEYDRNDQFITLVTSL